MAHNTDVVSLTFLGFLVNNAIDEGKGNDIPFHDIHTGIANRNLFEDLDRRYPDTFDFSLFPFGSEKEEQLYELLDGPSVALEGRERRKTGVENNGLCLLLALILEGIQQLH